jgi:hypothetical protein
MTDFMNLMIKLTQSFEGVYRGIVCVHVFIGVSARTYMSICVCTVFLKKGTGPSLFILNPQLKYYKQKDIGDWSLKFVNSHLTVGFCGKRMKLKKLDYLGTKLTKLWDSLVSVLYRLSMFFCLSGKNYIFCMKTNRIKSLLRCTYSFVCFKY